MSAALADADLSDLDEALRHLSLVPATDRGVAWYAYLDALLEKRATLASGDDQRGLGTWGRETRVMQAAERR